MPSLSVALLVSAPAWRGSGASFGKIATGLARAGHRPLLVTAADDVTRRFVQQGLPVRQLPLVRTGWRELREVGRLLREWPPDVVLADAPRDLRLAAAATGLHRTPIIFRYNLSGRPLPGDPVSRIFFARIAAVVLQSGYARDRACRTSPWLMRRPHRVIGNGYDGEALRPDPAAGVRFRQRHRIPPAQPVILSGAALYHDKGYAVALQAVARLAERRPLTYVVCGDGAERAALEGIAAELRMPALFLGQLGASDLADAMNAADVVLHPAPGELFPNLVAEAMARERAVIGVDSGATPELLGRDGMAGRLVATDDPELMASELEKL
ncbi:MAG TPA: glycosyltransferase family 4 protein, partial [Gemmatimonadales bacterium]